MSRLHLTFECKEVLLAGTLDTAPGATGLLIVSGGNEIRSGAFSGQSDLAANIAKAGFPVFRFDRRGIGDSEGHNRGFRKSSRDITAAIAAFRALTPQMERLIAFGNCDAASALMLAGGLGCDGLILSNPWTFDGEQEPGEDAANDLPPAAIRARYLQKLGNPREIVRLISGEVSFRKLLRGVARSFRASPPPSSLAAEIRSGIAGFRGDVHILLATADRTAQIFESAWGKEDPRIHRCDGAGHAYAEPEHRAWLTAEVLAALRN